MRQKTARYVSHSRRLLPVLLLWSMLFCATAFGQGDTCQTGVKVKFKASLCPTQAFNITLAGGVASGAGNCSSNNWVNTNEVEVELKPNQSYPLTVGTGSCSTHIKFDVPSGYKLEINDKETTTLDQSGSSPGSGDGTWNVVLRETCACSCNSADGGPPADSSGQQVGSVLWGTALGTLSDGRSAGSINIRERALTSAIYTPAALIYSPPARTNEVEVIRTTGGALRQIKAPQTLADVVTLSSSEFEIRFYQPADVGSKVNGLYTVTAAPFAIWKIKNPAPATLTRMQISKTQNSVTETGEYNWVAANDSWTLTTGGGARVETKTETTDAATGERSETWTVKDGTGKVVSKKTKTYHPYAWGEELLREVLDPDGAALTTLYSYYENASEEGKYRKLKTLTHADGSWQQYDYDAYGNTILALRPWKDSPLASATEENSRATRYTYSNYDGIEVSLFPRHISSQVEKINGVIVKKTTYLRAGTTVNGQPAVRESVTEHVSETLGLTTATTSYHSTATPFYANRIAMVEYPDARQDTSLYERGNFVSNADPALRQFIPDALGAAQRDTIIHGTINSPDGVAFKTTKEITIRDGYGRNVLSETHVYRGADYDRVGWSAMDYDDRGHVTQTRRHNGQVTATTWGGDLKTSDTSESGVRTEYIYDTLKRVRTQTKKGIAAGGGYAAQADTSTTISYDPEGRQIDETTAGGSLSLIRYSVYDAAGRLQSETDPAGLTTNYKYTNGGRTTTVTLPGGAVQVQDKYLDGQAKSMSGTAVVARYFDYGVNADGTQYTQEFTGSAGLASPRWTKTTSDWLGRAIRTERPGFSSGATVVQVKTYNVKGQLEKESVTSGATLLVADKLYEYDELSAQIRAGSDVDASGTLTLASIDRVSDTERLYEQIAGDWFSVTTAKSYLVDNAATPTISSQRERLTNFPVNGVEQTVAELIVIDSIGSTTKTTTVADRAAKKVTQRIDTPDSTTDAVSITINGLLQSSTPATPQSATTYAYDSMGRPSGVTDPKTGTATKAYNSAGQLTSEGNAVQTTNYEYYAATQPHAGKLKAKIDGNSKKVYFNYNSRGELTQTWGDTTYPLEYVYDAYGQKAELHTYRLGSGWAGSSWPVSGTGTTDVTKWIYHEPTGLLQKKQDAAGKQVVYTYDAFGRTATRTWARTIGAGTALTTSYAYDPKTGEMTGIDYSDTTPDVTFAYDRGGRQRGVIDASGAHTLTLNTRGELQSDQIAGGLLDGIAVTAGYDALLRRNSLTAARNGTTLASQTYGYDATSRLQTITSGGQTATYAYYPTSGLLNTTTFTGGTQIAQSYDTLGRRQTISTTTPTLGTVAGYTYVYNNLSQRTRVTREDGSYWSYIYNDRGELTSGKKYWADTTPVAGQQTEYSVDNIGNRNYAKSGGDAQGASLRQANYAVNALNQYVQRTNPGAIDVTGTADAAATVTVNDQATQRKGAYFRAEVPVNNGVGAVSVPVSVVGVRGGAGANGEDAVTTQGGQVFVAAALESYGHDADGNLLQDGRWQYAWDAENRLISMQALGGVPAGAMLRLEFAYDYMGRRIQKKVYGWNSASGSYQLASSAKFVYDGWNLLAELDGSNALVRSYVWGQDISGSLQGASGIGGLLLISEAGNHHLAGYDGSENVTSLIKAGNGIVTASYDYDPFGNILKATGEYAASNPMRFSTKYTDHESSFVYFGYRFYSPHSGRWLSRDPIAPEDGINLYAYVVNAPTNFTDPDGLQIRSDRPFRREKGKKYDLSSPNWHYAVGSLDRTYHALTLCIPKLSMDDALRKVYAGLQNFENFEPNIAKFTPVGATGGHFEINDPGLRGQSKMAGHSIDILLHSNFSAKTLLAVTTGDHPLVGVRMWRVEKAGHTTDGNAVVKITTEAYDQSNGLLNDVGRSLLGRSQQRIMWRAYLYNIEAHWYKTHKATRVGRLDEFIHMDQSLPNPFQRLLPSHLQSSRFIDYEHIY